MTFFAQNESHDLSESLVVENATKLFNSAYFLNLGDFQWSDLKHFVLDPDELRELFDCYKTLYPREEIEPSSSNVLLGTEKFGSKLDRHNLRSARIIAPCNADDGSIDTSAPRRPGIVNF